MSKIISSFDQPATNKTCPLRDLMSFVDDKWSLQILFILAVRTWRFGELHRQISQISKKVLTHTLRQLERDGMVKRRLYQTKSLRVEYSLTEMGVTIIPVLTSLLEWGKQNNQHIKAARMRFDRTVEPR